MVFETLVANLLNQYLSDFVDELTAKQLNLFAWSGSISLDNIAVKANAFDSLNLPFRVTHGHIARIEASFPWKSIYSSPVVIKLSDVYVVAVPNSETKYDNIKEELIEWNNKQKQLEEIEEAKQRSKEANKDSEDTKTDDTFAGKLAAQVIKNLQVFITNVHICYEDQISWPKNPFQVGLTLHKLVFETQTNEHKKDSNDNIIYKLVTLEGLAFYWNCNQTDLLSKLDEKAIDELLKDRIADKNKTPNNLQYILWPINFTTNAVINRKPASDHYNIPVLDVEMDLDVFELRMTRMQFESLLLLLDAIDRMNLGQPYRKWRPSVPIHGNAKNWWRFALTANLETDIRRRSNNRSWKVIREHRIKMRRYQDFYKQKLLAKNFESIKEELERLEKDLNLFSVVLARSQAEVETQQILKNKKEEPKKGWFSGWFSKSEDKSEANIVNDFKNEMDSKEKQKLYEAIGYEEGIPEELPQDFIAHKIQFMINKLFITVSDENATITQLSLIGVSLNVKNRPSSQCLSISNSVKSLYISGVGGILLLEEKSTANELTANESTAKESTSKESTANESTSKESTANESTSKESTANESTSKESTANESTSKESTANESTSKESTVLSLKFDMNPLDKQYDYGLIMRMSGFKLIYDANTINTLVEMMSPPQDISLDELQSIAAFKLQDFSEKTATGLKYTIEKHKQIKLNVDIEPSYVIIPQLGRLENANNILLFSLGHVKLTSQLIPKSEIPKVRDLVSSHSDRELIQKMRQMAYESYKCHISEVQMILSDVEHWQNDLKSPSTTRHLLYPVEFNLTIERSIVPNDPHLAKIKVEGQLPNIELKISDKQLTNLMNLLLTLPFGNSSNESNQDETDGSKMVKASPRSIPTIESSKMMSAAIDLVKERVKEMVKEESDGDKPLIIYKTVIFDFKLKQIVVSLFEGPDRSPQSAIALAKLDRFEVYGEVYTDSSLSVTCHIGDLCLNDVRTSRSTAGIKTLFEKNQLIPSSSTKEHKDSIFTIFFTQKSTERLIEITISGFRLILALDYLLNLSNIITKAFEIKSDTTPFKKVDKPSTDKPLLEGAVEKAKQLQSSVDKSEITNVLHFNLSQMEIVLLESIEVINASAVIMGCHSDINIKMKPNFIQLYGEVSEISALMTNYERYIASQEIEAYIMRPTNLVINGTINGEVQMLDITFSGIQFFISPPMVNIVLNILSEMGSSAVKSDSIESQKLNNLKLFELHPNDTKSRFLSYVPEAQEATEDFVDVSDKPVISTKQQVYLNIKSISFIVESGGLDSQPLIKMNSYFYGKLVGYKSLSANCSLIAEYYNENNFFWEPLIEPVEGKSNPWDFEIKVLLEDNGKIDVKLESNEQLEMTITKTSIFVLSSLNEAFANAIAKQLPFREDNIVIVRNFLGIDLNLYLSNSSLKTRPDSQTKVNSVQDKTVTIKTGNDMSLIANDLKEVELNIGLLLSSENEILRRITCHGHVIRCFNLPQKSYPHNDFWKWVVEVQVIDAFTKTITFKSNAQIVNQFTVPLDIYCVERTEPMLLGRVEAYSNLELPLDAVYGENCELKLKPSEEYGFSDQTIDWRNTIDKINGGKGCLSLCEPILTCFSVQNPQKKFYVKVKCDNKEVLFEDTNATKPESVFYQIRLIPIVKFRNLLPYRITYAIENIDELFSLESGQESDLSNTKLGETGISINLCDYLEKDWNCKKIPTHGNNNDIELWRFSTASHDKPLTLNLAVKLSIESSSLIFSLFAPFWMINRTSQQLVYRVDDETVFFHAPTLKTPILLSFKPSNFFCKKKLSLSVGDSRFSDGFSIDVVGSKGNIIAKSKNGKYNYYVSVDIQLSRIGLSKIVTITPFYSIINVSKKALEISEDNDEWFRVETRVDNGMSNTAFWPKQSKEQTIYFRFDSKSLTSETPNNFIFLKTSSTLICVDEQYLYVDVDISEWDATIKISDYFEGSDPVLLVNALKGAINYGQKGVSVLSSKTGEQKHVNSLPPNHSILYTWYLPSGERRLVWKYDSISEEQIVDLTCDQLLEVNDVFIVSFLEGKQRVLLFTNDYLLATNALQAGEITKPKINVEFVMKGIGLSIVNNEAKKDMLYMAITSSVLWEIREPGNKKYKPLPAKSIDAIEGSYQTVQLKKRVGETVSIISNDAFQMDFTDSESPKLLTPKTGQLRRLANRGIWISLSMSEHIIQCHLKVNRLQIDNQMPDHIFPIVMCPIAPPKTIAVEQSPKSFIELSTIIQKQPTTNRFKYNSILIQEFLIQIDRGLLSSIQELLEVAVKKENNQKLISKDIRDILQRNTITESFLSSRKTYYDFIHFSPLKVHVSFSLGGTTAGLELPFGLDFLIRSAGVTLTEFNDVVFKLDYFERRNLLVENSELTSIVTKHYTTQVLKQFYKLVLGLDLIGNPMKLALGLKDGVGDFFYEPFQGIIQGPGEFAEGLQIGIKSLASNVVGGAAGALGSITNTIGEGVSALTFDDKFRRERRTRLNKKSGFAESGKSLFKGFLHGVTGVITQPIEGVRQDGIEGLFKGVGKGVVGIVAQPTTGIIDFTSGTLQAVKRTVDPNKEAKRMRPPRYVGRDSRLHPYNRNYAFGHTLLREMENGKYSSDHYIIHRNLGGNTLILLTDKRLMSIKKALISNQWESDWFEEWTNCQKVSISEDRLKIRITLKEQKKMFGIFSGDSDRIITTNSSDTTQWLFEKIDKQINR